MAERQAVVVYISSELVRAMKPLVGQTKPYADISELAELSIQNQLVLESGGQSRIPASGEEDETTPSSKPSLLALPGPGTPTLVAVEEQALNGPISPFTNRLFPVKLACRVLANCPENVSLGEFQQDAAKAAREVGQILREEDAELNRKGMSRRWVAMPVGGKGASTLNRFINHFTITQKRDGTSDGPLVRLGLGALDSEGRPKLTKLGWKLAREPNPVLDHSPDDQGGETLSPTEKELFVRAISSNRAERENLAEFRVIVNATSGQQGAIDERLRNGRDLNHDEGAAYRAGTIGRSHDLSLVTVKGTGEGAQIVLSETWPWAGVAR